MNSYSYDEKINAAIIKAINYILLEFEKIKKVWKLEIKNLNVINIKY